MLTNIRSYKNKFNEVLLFLKMEDPDILCLIETWLTKDVSDSVFCPPGFNVVRRDRDSRGGGVLLLIRSCISFRQICVPGCFSHIELICVDVSLGCAVWRIIGYYRSGGFDDIAREYAIDTIECLKFLCNGGETICLLGDFNLPLINWKFNQAPNNEIYNVFLKFFREYGLYQFVRHSTRHENILDLVMSNDPQFISTIEVQCPISTSDHNVICFVPNIQLSNVAYNQSPQVAPYDFLRADYHSLNRYLQAIDWGVLFEYCHSVEDCWAEFRSRIDLAFRAYVPRRLRHRRPIKWHPPFIYTMLRAKCKLWQIWRSGQSVDDKIKYYSYAKACRNSIAGYYASLELGLLRDGGRGGFYRYINRKLRSRVNLLEIALPSGTLTRSPSEMGAIFNLYFSSVFTIDDNKKPITTRANQAEMSEIIFTPSAVRTTLLGLGSSLSTGPDGIPNIFLKECASSLALPLTHIFDISLKDQILPCEWKIALVTPIHKKGPTTSPGNYRPISITSTCCRAMERIMNRALMYHLTHHKLISEDQHGFVKGKSTTTNLLESTQQWSGALQSRQSVDIIYLDFKKAFDSVSHKKLLAKLLNYGIHTNTIGWLSNFLSERKQRVNISGNLSDIASVTSGVPQGSVLGPTLFSIYINDLSDIFKDTDVVCRLFADDVKLYCSKTSSEVQLQSALNKVVEWSSVWQLQLAPEKCQIFSVTGLRGRGCTHEYFINGRALQRVSRIRDLGVIVDPDLKFVTHIDAITHKAAAVSWMIRASFSSGDQRVLKLAYCTYVRPILEYCSAVWNPHHRYLIDRVEKIQKRFTKSIPSLSKYPYMERLKHLKLMTLERRRLLADLALCYKLLNGLVDSPFLRHLLPIQEYASTRGHNFKLRYNRFSRDITKFSFCNRIVRPWNALPSEIVNSGTISRFNALTRDFDFNTDLIYA